MFRGTRNFADFAPSWRLMMVLIVCLMSMGSVAIAIAASSRQKSFPSPEEAMQALLDAARNNDTQSLLQILEPEAQSLMNTGDAVSDRARRAHFVQAYEEAHALVQSGDTKVILQSGRNSNQAYSYGVHPPRDHGRRAVTL
jgi:hypothetical protein